MTGYPRRAAGVRTMLGEVFEGDELTRRDLEAVRGAADGETAAETGARLHLATETVKEYRKRACAKLGARSIAHAVAIALRDRHIA